MLVHLNSAVRLEVKLGKHGTEPHFLPVMELRYYKADSNNDLNNRSLRSQYPQLPQQPATLEF